MPYSCNKCRHDLYGKPKIFLEGQIYCFRCSRIVKEEIKKAKIEEFKKTSVYKNYEDMKLKYELEKSSRLHKEKELDSKNDSLLRYFFTIPLAVICASLWKGKPLGLTDNYYGDIVLIIILVFVGLVILAKVGNKRSTELDLSNPIQTFQLKEPKGSIRVNVSLMPNEGSRIDPDDYPLAIFNRDNYICQKCRQEKELEELQIKELHHNSDENRTDPTTMITVCKDCIKDKDIKNLKIKMKKLLNAKEEQDNPI